MIDLEGIFYVLAEAIRNLVINVAWSYILVSSAIASAVSAILTKQLTHSNLENKQIIWLAFKISFFVVFFVILALFIIFVVFGFLSGNQPIPAE
jgi:hypothetical protein